MEETVLAYLYRFAGRWFFGDSEHGDWIHERIQRFRTVWVQAANLFYYTLRRPQICDIVTIQLEPVFACNLKCKYCPGHETPGRVRPRLMSQEIFRRTVDRLPPTVEAVQFALLGEPMLHPDLGGMIDYVHRRKRRAIVYTNGTLLHGERLDMLVQSCVDVVNVSVEMDAETSQTMRGVNLDSLRQNVIAFIKRKSPRTEVKLSAAVHKGNVDRVPRLYAYWGDLVRHFKVFPVFSLGTVHPAPDCMEMWRGNLNVWTNGNVSPCCFDPDGELVIGNVLNGSLRQMIRGPRMKALLEGIRAGRPSKRCYYCYKFDGYRPGFHVRWADAVAPTRS